MKALPSNWWYNGIWDGWSDVVLIILSVAVISVVSVILAEIMKKRKK